jgi:hypothetical protein
VRGGFDRKQTRKGGRDRKQTREWREGGIENKLENGGREG